MTEAGLRVAEPRQVDTMAAKDKPSQPIPMRRPRGPLNLDTTTPVNEDGCFDSDRVIKSGYVEKRTSKTKQWKPIYLVLRPNALSIYKNDKETKLRHQIHLSDLTAVASLKDPKHRREHVFGLFSPAKNFHLQAPSGEDAQQWVDLIRREARIEEEEEEMFLASPTIKSAHEGFMSLPRSFRRGDSSRDDGVLSSSPEGMGGPSPHFFGSRRRRQSSMLESSGMSGNEMASHSDFSDNDVQRMHGASIESLAVQTPIEPGTSLPLSMSGSMPRPDMSRRSQSQASMAIANGDPKANANNEQDLDRIVWQGWVWMLRTKGGVRQWKDMWGVLRPRNFILYKDESEYTAQWIVQLPAVVDVVDIDALSKSKTHCFQVITEEKSYRFCARDEEALVQCLGAWKSLLAKRRGLEGQRAGHS